ncbi:uncharacterized protein DUF4307 [Haloactinospora alba]|uniref:Uncharacterized protein DUF4307 n=1 Tax=Haloactinospora alba TaxID=405555 RepID=A0A543NM50_9ACTN|nr:DUF4307 domain-containing protein [Haloactinospora alba]TQN32893.1 uncharacterized protein DUF4307 [Haloactinospora alba]
MPDSPSASAPRSGTTPEGGRSQGKRPVLFIIGVLVAIVFTVGWGLALRSYGGSGTGVSTQTVAWKVVSDQEASITFQVSGDSPVSCLIKASDAQHVDVGQTEVDVAADDRNVTATVETVREASTVEVASCREQGSAK